MINSTIKCYGGNVSLETSDEILAVEIFYKGKFQGNLTTPDGFLAFQKYGRIIIIKVINREFPESLFKYSGIFDIKRVLVYTATEKYPATIERIDHRFGKLTEVTYSSLTTEWERLSEPHVYENKTPYISRATNKSNIITQGIKSVSGKLCLSDGTPYYGDVHLHSSVRFMTGKTYTKDSKRLYANQNLNIKRRK